MVSIFFTSISTVFALSIISGFLGPFMIWKRISYFGDTLAHSGLLALTIGSACNNFPSIIFTILLSVVFAIIISKVKHSRDTALSIMSSSAIAISVFLISAFPKIFKLKITGILFGDILLVNFTEIAFLYAISAVVLYIFIFNWRNWVMIAIDEDFAASRGINITLSRMQLIAILAVFISFAINIVGALLVTSLLIIPAATARFFSSTPMQMVFISFLICFFGSTIGLLLSAKIDSPAGTSMAFALICLLGLSFLYSAIAHKIQLWKAKCNKQ